MLAIGLTSCQDDEFVNTDLAEDVSSEVFDSVDFLLDSKGNAIGFLDKELNKVDLDGNPIETDNSKYNSSSPQRVVMYQHTNFNGSRWAWYGGSLNVLIKLDTSYSGVANNQGSSAIVAPNCSVTFYDNANGTSVIQSYPRVPFPRYIVNFVPLNLNDRVSSIRVTCASNANSFAGYAYDGTSYSGKSFPFYAGDNINPRNFSGWSNTTISSIAMNGFSDAHFLHLDDTSDGEFLRALSQNKDIPNVRWKGMQSSNVRFLAKDYDSDLEDTDINTLAGQEWQTINDLYYDISQHQNHPTTTVTQDELDDFCITAAGQCQASAGNLETEQSKKEFWQEYIGGIFGSGAGVAYLSVANRLGTQGFRPDQVARAFIRGFSKHVTRAHEYLMGEELQGETTSEVELSNAFSNGSVDVAPEAGESVASTGTTAAGEGFEVIADSSGEIIELAGAVVENAVVDTGAVIGAEATGAAAAGTAVAAGASAAGVEAGEAIVAASVFEIGAMTCGIGALVVVGGIGIWKLTHRHKIDQHEDCKIFATNCESSGFGGLFEVGVDYTNPPGTITARAEIGSYEGKEKAFDNSITTKWLDNAGAPTTSNPSWIQIVFPQAKVVDRLAITSGNDAPTRDPQNFRLRGSNNGSTWTTLKSWTGENWNARRKKREFKFDNTFTFKYYRLETTRNRGNINMTQLSEIELFGPPQ
ncbi:discoidin domain-containing protein [Kordia jejudonensis]|uniref:discoidin domain-containing protein n=1 Tax=Kordia jejudonensis TaxID=1348245 RepID=UPI00138DDEBE|nr:discoidin domain-containing protein [Kordia jejudonensis]